MEDIKISFIIPVYNPSEIDDYFSECIKSIVKVRHNNDEILVIDDGSQNSSYIQEICRRHEDVSIIRIGINSGISNARNIGIETCRNEYYTIIDSDDRIYNPEAFERIRKGICESPEYDLYIFGSASKRGEKLIESISSTQNVDLNDMRIQTINMQDGDYQPKLHSVGTAWAKIYRKKFIKENKLKYIAEPNRAEDHIFFLDLLNANPMIKVINEFAYYYRYNISSISNQYNKNDYELIKNTTNEIQARVNYANKREVEAFNQRKANYIILAINKIFHKDNPLNLWQKRKQIKYILDDNNNLYALNQKSTHNRRTIKKILLISLLQHKLITPVVIVFECRKFLLQAKINSKAIIENIKNKKLDNHELALKTLSIFSPTYDINNIKSREID